MISAGKLFDLTEMASSTLVVGTPIRCRPTTATEPADRAFVAPVFGQHDELTDIGTPATKATLHSEELRPRMVGSGCRNLGISSFARPWRRPGRAEGLQLATRLSALAGPTQGAR